MGIAISWNSGTLMIELDCDATGAGAWTVAFAGANSAHRLTARIGCIQVDVDAKDVLSRETGGAGSA